jgi:branched-chain amino acid transport system permease protein
MSGPYQIHLLVMGLMYSILALSLNLSYLSGYLSIAHAAFMALGAYTSAILTVRYGMLSWVCVPFAVLVVVILSLCIGLLTLRMRGIYFIMMTFAFGEIIRLIMANWESFLGGHTGITGILPPTPLPFPGGGEVRFTSKLSYYYLMCVGLFVMVLILNRFMNSRVGRAMTAIKSSSQLAESVGINVPKYRLLAFVTGSACAGACGSFYAHYAYYVSPELSSFWDSVNLIVMIMVGGGGVFPVAGPIVGAFFMTIVPELFRASKKFQHVFAACVLILVIRFFPGGILGLALNAAQKGKQIIMQSSRARTGRGEKG